MRFTIVAACAVAGALLGPTNGADAQVTTVRPISTVGLIARRDTAVFAGGCFWGIEAVYRHTRGVLT